MQQNERKGAWTLFVAILIFGALVWGYGGYERDKARKAAENGTTKVSEKIIESDSTDYYNDKIKKSKGKKVSSRNGKKGTSKSGGSAGSDDPVRDILGDPIKTE